ncbi:MAG: hypothetical protein QOI37_1788 [Chloroflexota bacterium]|nr:hypothetical protein [Chloroflexota bacterium]
MPDVTLRPIDDSDLDALFDQMRDPESVQMAAFTAKEPNDRDTFDTRMAKSRTAPDGTMRAVIRDGRPVGSIASFVVEGETEITYWIDRSVWGRGIASQASGVPAPARAGSERPGEARSCGSPCAPSIGDLAGCYGGHSGRAIPAGSRLQDR